MHVRDARAFARLGAVYAALDECVAFATEYDLRTAPAQPDHAALYLPEGKSLKDYLSDRAYQRLRRILHRTFGIDLDHHRRLRPLLLVNLISEQLLAAEHPQPLDLHLWERAETAGKLLLGLENYQEQEALLQRLPVEQQVRSLQAIGRHPARFRRQVQSLADRYTSGDLRALYQATRRRTGAARRVLIFERNERLATRFDEVAQQQSLFAAVGAAHLPGGKGMLRLLKHAGYRLRPVQHRDSFHEGFPGCAITPP